MAALKAEVNATKTALATEVALKLGGGATVDATLPRFTGDVTCYVEDATGDVVGLQLGSSAPLCSTAGTPRSFAVPADGYIADVKVVVDKATGLVGGLTFVVKSNASLVPTNVVTCGTHGGVGVSVMPKLAALAGVTATCKPAQSGRRLHQAGGSGLALDPVSLSVVATTANAPSQGLAPTPAPTPAPRYAYVINVGGSSDSVSVCQVSGSTGALSQCAPYTQAGSGFNIPNGVAVSGGYLYVVNVGGSSDSVSVCQVSGSTGALSLCAPYTQSGSGFNIPAGIALSGGYAYVTNRGGSGDSVSVCRVSGSTGALSLCAPYTQPGSGFAQPAGIALSGS